MSTDLLGGELIIVILFFLLVALPLGLAAAWLILNRYRQAVSQVMGTSSSTTQSLGISPSPIQPNAPRPGRSLHIQVEEAESAPLVTAGSDPLARREKSARVRLALVYAFGGAAQALIIALFYFPIHEIELRLYPFFFLWLTLAWPVSLSAMEILSATPRRKWLIPAGILLIFVLVAPSDAKGMILIFWPVWVAIPALISAAAFHPKVRTVAPIAIGIALFAIFVLNLALSLAYFLGVNFVSGATAIVIAGLIALAVLVFGGRAIAIRFARRYTQKAWNDPMLLLNLSWLLYALWQSAFLAPTIDSNLPFFLGLTTLLGYAAFWWIVRYGLHWASSQINETPNVPLLLLRVFRFPERSAQLMDELSLRWRFLGNIHLIAAPDLALGLLEPHELINFVSGRMETGYVSSRADLESRLPTLDTQRDPDGRFRVHEFFAYDNTWLFTVQQLIDLSQVVLMDLRSYSPQRRGCTEEIRQLFNRIDLQRVVFLVNGETDMDFLRGTMEEAWAGLVPLSPNRASPSPTARVVRMSDHSAKAITFLLGTLFGAVDKLL